MRDLDFGNPKVAAELAQLFEIDVAYDADHRELLRFERQDYEAADAIAVELYVSAFSRLFLLTAPTMRDQPGTRNCVRMSSTSEALYSPSFSNSKTFT